MSKFQWMNLYKYCSCLKREKRLLGLRRLGVRVPYGAPIEPCDCNNHRVRFFTGRHLGYIFEAPAEAAFAWQHGEKNAKRWWNSWNIKQRNCKVCANFAVSLFLQRIYIPCVKLWHYETQVTLLFATAAQRNFSVDSKFEKQPVRNLFSV